MVQIPAYNWSVIRWIALQGRYHCAGVSAVVLQASACRAIKHAHRLSNLVHLHPLLSLTFVMHCEAFT